MLFVVLLFAAVQAAPAPSPLAGDWIVDLTGKPGDKPYVQPMQLTLNPEGTVTGNFYRSTIEAGRWKTDRGRTCAAFRTSDGKGPYHTSACLTATGVSGQTWAEQRNFVFNWDAVRGKVPD